MDINKYLQEIINTLNFYNNNLDYEHLTSILRNNSHILIFLGKKRNHNKNSKYPFKIDNAIKNLNKRNNLLKKNNCQNNLYNTIDENKNDDEKLFTCEKVKYNKELLNNSKKVIRYYKNVYIYNNLLKEKNPLKKQKRNRSSKYRGVSKNGIGWQVLMMFKNNKPYIGTYNSEELAARIYDIASIKRNGISSKTNFKYNNEQIERILKVNINFKDKNISSVISELIK